MFFDIEFDDLLNTKEAICLVAYISYISKSASSLVKKLIRCELHAGLVILMGIAQKNNT